MSIKVKIALGVGEKFAIVDGNKIGHIALENTHTLVEVDGETFCLYKGKTFEESQKVDEFFDRNSVKEMYIKEHLADREKDFDVTITRLGCVKVRAKNAVEAMRKANELPTSSIAWNEDWNATDAYAEE